MEEHSLQWAAMDLDALIDRFRGPLVGLLASWGASPRDAVELAQDAFAEAYLSRERFEGEWEDAGAAGAWLRGIANKLWLAHGRMTRRPDAIAARELAPVEATEDESGEDDSAARLRALIDGLPQKWKTVLHLRYVEDSGLEEIAGLLGVSERAVEGRLHRARRALKERLDVAACGAAGDGAEDAR